MGAPLTQSSSCGDFDQRYSKLTKQYDFSWSLSMNFAKPFLYHFNFRQPYNFTYNVIDFHKE